MRRHTQSGSGKQIPLAFNLMASPESTSVLRTAYTRLELSQHLTFEQVMSDRLYAIGVRNLADAIVRREASGHSTKGTPTTSEIGKPMDSLLELRPAINYSGDEKGDR
jgi:hypothetical protein